MLEVPKKDYHKFLKFAENNTCNRVYPLSILEENQSGQVFADSMDNPKSALFWHQCGFAYISGELNECFLSEVTALIRNEKQINKRRFILNVENKDWDDYFVKQHGILI